ncbi:MAG: Phospholipase C [Chaenotheca gracillima]|nr:MAG: Phospholipase C [Chaenotheca gracillima]
MSDTKIYTHYFDPLRFTTGSTERLSPEEDSHLLETIPNLLSVALGPSARGPVLRSSAAASWHQALFKSLVEFAGLQMATGGDQEVEQAQVNVLDQLLQIAADSRINLETEFLSALVASFSGILALGEGKVHWPLVEKVLLLDANVFLIPQSQSDDSSSINNLTKALFRQITLLGQGARASYKDYDRVQQRVLSPLMGEFAKARDLLGFLRYWREELEFLGEARFAQSPLDESSATTLFENDGVRRDLRALLEQNLTTGQISEAIEEASQSLNLEQSSPQLKARAFAGMVILDNIVGSLTGYETADTLADVLLKNFQLVSSHVVSGVWDQRIRWRLWRTLARLNRDVLVDTLGTVLRDMPEAERLKLRGFIQDVLKKVGQAMDEVTLSSWRVPIKPEIYSEAFEAFDFICKFTTQNARVLDLERPAFDLTEDLIRRLNLFIQGGLEASVPLIKQNDLQLGGQRVFRSPAAWAVSMMVLLISNHSAILLRASTKLRQGFIQNITDVIGMTAGSDLPAAFQGVVTQDLQAVILNSESIVNSASLKGDLVDAILERLRAHRKQDALGILAVEGLLELPGQTMNRAQREEILNKIVEDANTHHFNNSRSVAQKQISLMVKLMQMPNASSNLVAEAESLWSLAATLEVVDQQEGPRFDDDTRRGFEQLVRLVLKHHLSNPAQERSQRYLTSSHRRLIETISKTRSFSDNLLNLGLIKASEDTLWPLDHDLAKTNGVESLESVHEEYLEILYSDLTGLRGCLRNGHSSNNEVILEEILDAVVAAVQLRAPADIHDLVDELQAVFGPTQVNRTHRHRHHRIEIRCFVALAELYDPNDSEDDAEADELYLLHRIANYSNNRLQTSDRKQVLKALRCNAERVNDEQRVSLIQSLRDDISKAKGDMSENLVLLRAMIPSITDQPTISSIHTTLTNALPTTDTTRAFLLASASIIEILTTKHRSITQWMIESTLTAIVLTSTNLSHPTCQNAKHSIMAYTRLCKILSTILTAHRVRLRGRFHLVLQVLRALLRRLFPSSASSTSSTTSANSPPPPLPPSAAQSFTSLLMALCDPTVSSVTTGSTASRKNRGGQALTPATDKAAHLAGQYLPYLLLEYVSCQLRAPLGADVRAALAPGLYAILDVVPVETRRMLGAACDAEGRAVLRALWEEWLVLGEGRGEHDDDEGRERGHRRR